MPTDPRPRCVLCRRRKRPQLMDAVDETLPVCLACVRAIDADLDELASVAVAPDEPGELPEGFDAAAGGER